MRILKFIAVIIALSGCSNFSKNEKTSITSSVLYPGLISKIEASFSRRNINGCFILYDLQNDTSVIYNQDRANQKFLPASTFKILNSLIALECEVIMDENEVILWDSVERSFSIWNQDHTLKTGIKNSVVWFYQELARRIGEERMQKWVDSVGYGNQQISKEIDNFWLVGDLRISPLEQVEFLKKFIVEDLPFQDDIIKTVKEILIVDKTDAYVLRAKTGWATFGIPVGWYIGYIKIKGDTYIFVNNIEIRDSTDARARKEITREVFKAIFNIDLSI